MEKNIDKLIKRMVFEEIDRLSVEDKDQMLYEYLYDHYCRLNKGFLFEALERHYGTSIDKGA